jgi:hypothetical protein
MNKKNLILLLILLFFLALTGIYQYFWLPKTTDSAKEENWLAQVDLTQADKIIIKRDGKEIVLNKDGARWRVIGEGVWYVEDTLIDNLKNNWAMATSSKMFIVSNDKTTKPTFKTDGSLSVKLLIKDKTLSELAVGLTRASYTYIAKPDSDVTFEVGGDLRSAFDYAEWRDLSIFSGGGDTIKQIKITQNKTSIFLKKEGTNWQLVGNAKVKLNQDKVGRIASLMGELSANSIPDQKSQNTGLDKNNWTVEATGDGFKNVLIIGQEAMRGKEASGDLFVKTATSSNIYLLGKNLVGVFQASLKDLTI